MYTNEDYLVNLYLNGEEMPEDFSIEKFEDTPSLMTKAIEKSKDIKLYDLCSDNVKKDYNFVLKLIELFPIDGNIEDKANYFIENSDNEVEQMRVFIAAYKKGGLLDSGIDLFSQYYGLNFSAVLDHFKDEPDIVEYIAYREAESHLESIITEDCNAEEQVLHQYDLKIEKIDSRIIYMFLINLLPSDSALRGYIRKHLDLIKGPYDKVVGVIKDWKKYQAELYLNKVQFLQEYFFRLKNNMEIDPELLYYIARRYDLFDFLYNVEEEEIEYTPEADETMLDVTCVGCLDISFETKELIDAGFYLLNDKQKEVISIIDDMFQSQKKEEFDEYVYEAALNTVLGKGRK